MDSDWDLQAVVRGCCSAVSSATTTATTTITTTIPTQPLDGYYTQQKSTLSSFFPDLYHPTNDNNIEQFINNLYNYNPLRCRNLQKPPPPPPLPSHQSLPISTFSFGGGLHDPLYHNHHHRLQQPEKQFQVKEQSLGISGCTTTHAQVTTKIKKRKNQIKRVCQVPADGSSPDSWSWRKYGQKPIKGSPYPRGYYRCSTLKGCSARKQVERDRSNPGMLIITYTGEHSHPVPTHVNSLAGSTRNKTIAAAGDDNNGNKPTPSSPISPVTSLPPASEKMDESHETERDETDDDNNFDVSGVVIDDDTFDGLDELVAGSVSGDKISDHYAATSTGFSRVQMTRVCQITWLQQPLPLPAGVDF